ncbi:metallophosphoesterase family protein [Hoyosella altamirensis]|uniref:3',5'-cyclic AMP phosphodiesterase CpdA n=1 Tax=Hoyosella altamirensis TaxID=616997 RepID=A0A839RR28_9ACTN|nr:metallophosphoesterase [Hoyosella altamirensis]MBB3038564.1 3',5'-cyclic AMP phosphodiesterase CpdA [Hoyosella altamirensis]
MAKVFAVSDIHVGHRGNGHVLDEIQPESKDDWIIVAGDVAERTDDIRNALARIRQRFARVIWVPGNHELWTTARDPSQLKGVARYNYLVRMCRELGVLTPEDPYPMWEGEGGPVAVVPMFLLYDYTWRPEGTSSRSEALSVARDRGVMATDEFLLSSEPYLTRDAWCQARVAYTQSRLDELDPELPTVLINHWPLVRAATKMLMYPEFALWCGTDLTADWHVRYNALCAVYGHLHIPRRTFYDGVRFEEVSVGYPPEWKRRGMPKPILRQILPAPENPPPPLMLPASFRREESL